MDWMIMLAQLLLSLSFLVAVHEMGHLLAAKYFGMRVEQFSIGFPPKLWSFRKGDTEYAISAIPLGGYVKISGMIDESLDTEAMNQPPQPWEFRSKPAWQRLIVMLGGIVVNVIVGILIFIGLTFFLGDTYILKDEINKSGGFLVGPIGEQIGLKTGDQIVKINGKEFKYLQDIFNMETLLSTNGSYTVERDGKELDIPIPADFIENFSSSKSNPGQFLSLRMAPVIAQVQPGSVAEKMGLRAGDRIVEANGAPIQYKDQIDKQVQAMVKDSLSGNSDTVAIKVNRAGAEVAMKADFKNFRRQKMLGILVDSTPSEDFIKRAEERVTYGLIESIPLGTKRAFSMLTANVKAFGRVITGKLSAQKSISGPLGIMKAFGNQWDWARFWTLTGVLSLVLAFMNLLPIPALDGGHVMFLSYEIISRRKPSDKFLETAQKVGMLFLLALMVFIFANDIIKMVTPD
ncbi:RIP metalloprotease RseP [Chryseolinea sp. T2]|uniref:RIP metalloprotease RseP n=1 Tax=Chryseolinea sp. T2 TaxID=3129255 RepID=UPI003077C5F3